MTTEMALLQWGMIASIRKSRIVSNAVMMYAALVTFLMAASAANAVVLYSYF